MKDKGHCEKSIPKNETPVPNPGAQHESLAKDFARTYYTRA
jgi:hypothetical protein